MKIDTDQPNGFIIDSVNEAWSLEKGITVSGTNEFSLFETSASEGNQISIKGVVANTSHSAVGIDGKDTHFSLTADGVVDGAYAGVIVAGEGAVAENDGAVVGGSTGISFDAKAFDLTNKGSITGGSQAIDVHEAGGGHILNGVGASIDSDGTALFIETMGFQRTAIVNRGDMHGANFSVYATVGREHIVNTGMMYGNVHLGGGDDVLNSRGGGVLGDIDLGSGDDLVDLRNQQAVPAQGTMRYVYGGGGDDTFVVSDGTSLIVEGKNGGYDVLRSSVSGVLADNVEMLQLLGHADIDGAGNEGFNRVNGNLGDNHLRGFGGGDELWGDGGNDLLTGGADADTFFLTGGDGHDIVTDFEIGVDTVDLEDYDISFAALRHEHMHDVGDNLVIAIGEDTLTLRHVHADDLGKADFQL